MNSDRSSNPIIVALDVDSRKEALSLVDTLGGAAGMFKVGLELFLAEGGDVVRAIVERGERVFLDLKLHDIPTTVRRAAVEGAKLGASMITIHGAGGPAMIEASRKDLEDEFGALRPTLAVVTVLTSMDDATIAQTGVAGTAQEQVLRLGRMAATAGADGLVCSPKEVRVLKSNIDPTVKIITPGVRMPGQSMDDQKRVATPGEAIRDGADWVVIGRHVNRAEDPRSALLEVISSLGSPQE